jgi:predicted nucleic acid-binding protein
MIVVDASALAVALGDDGPDGARVRERLRGHRLISPDLIDTEVIGIVRRAARSGALSSGRADQLLVDLADLPLQRVFTARYSAAVWPLTERFTVHEASYLGLAGALDTLLLTADRRLAAVDGLPCQVELIS